MPSDPRPTVIGVLRDELGACIDREEVRGYSGLQSAWEAQAPPGFVWWFVDTFVGDPQQTRRMRGAYLEVRRFFNDLERLTGEKVPDRLVEALQRRVLVSFFPTSYEVLNHARGIAPERAAAQLKQRTEKIQWMSEF